MATNNLIHRHLHRQRERFRRESVFHDRFNPLEVLGEGRQVINLGAW